MDTKESLNRSDFISLNAMARAYLEHCITDVAVHGVESNLTAFRLDDDGKPRRSDFEVGKGAEHPILEASLRREGATALGAAGVADPFDEIGFDISEAQRQFGIDYEILLRHAHSDSQAPMDEQKVVAPGGRDHISDQLAVLNQAAARFWGNADRDHPDTQQSNATVVAWLQERGFSTRLAKSSASIIRPAWAHNGRKPAKK